MRWQRTLLEANCRSNVVVVARTIEMVVAELKTKLGTVFPSLVPAMDGGPK